MNFISAVLYSYISLCRAQILLAYKIDGIAEMLYVLNRDCLWTKFGFKTVLRIPKIFKSLLIFKLCPFSLRTKFYIPKKWTYLLVSIYLVFSVKLYFRLKPVSNFITLNFSADILFQTGF
jgi:hypothetical protein